MKSIETLKKEKEKIEQQIKAIEDKNKPDFKIFEGTVKSALIACLDAGYLPATLVELSEYRKKNFIDSSVWFDSGTIYYTETGVIRTFVKDDLQDVLGGRARVLYVGNGDSNYFLYGLNYLNYDGRFLGIKRK